MNEHFGPRVRVHQLLECLCLSVYWRVYGRVEEVADVSKLLYSDQALSNAHVNQGEEAHND